MTKNILLEKTFNFSLQIIELSRSLKSKNEYEIASQLLRSGTSIGANSEEANASQSRKEFISKLSIAYKEASETHYWLRLLQASNMTSDENNLKKLINEIIEIKKILSSIRITTIKNS